MGDIEKRSKRRLGLAFLSGLVAIAGAFSAFAETYTYDALGRLSSVTTDSGTVIHYCYDAAGNRTYVGTNACP